MGEGGSLERRSQMYDACAHATIGIRPCFRRDVPYLEGSRAHPVTPHRRRPVAAPARCYSMPAVRCSQRT
jgi:hypothetical protein